MFVLTECVYRQSEIVQILLDTVKTIAKAVQSFKAVKNTVAYFLLDSCFFEEGLSEGSAGIRRVSLYSGD